MDGTWIVHARPNLAKSIEKENQFKGITTQQWAIQAFAKNRE